MSVLGRGNKYPEVKRAVFWGRGESRVCSGGNIMGDHKDKSLGETIRNLYPTGFESFWSV